MCSCWLHCQQSFSGLTHKITLILEKFKIEYFSLVLDHFLNLFKTVKFKIQNLGSGLPFKRSVWADSVLEVKDRFYHIFWGIFYHFLRRKFFTVKRVGLCRTRRWLQPFLLIIHFNLFQQVSGAELGGGFDQGFTLRTSAWAPSFQIKTPLILNPFWGLDNLTLWLSNCFGQLLQSLFPGIVWRRVSCVGVR